MTPIRKQYLTAAGTAVALLSEHAVEASWEADSALEGFTVGGLAAHLGGQIVSGVEALEADYGGKDAVGVLEHFARAAWRGGDIGNEYNTAIREGGEASARAGHAGVVAAAAGALKTLHERVPGLGDDAVGGGSRWPYVMTFDDYLVTRILEIVVHADDLAVSAGVATPEFDPDVLDTAVWVLGRLAAARHGQAALVRALSRSERAPADISAL